MTDQEVQRRLTSNQAADVAEKHKDFSKVGPEGTLGQLLGQRLFVIMTRPVDEPAAAKIRDGAARPEHLAYIVALEKTGGIFAAGPLLGDDDRPSGTGMIVIRAQDREQAKSIAENDPMHQQGLRTFEIIPWKVNEGSYSVTVKYSDQSMEIA